MNNTVVIPVVQQKMAEGLFKCIDENTVQPTMVFIIDNTANGLNGTRLPKKTEVVTVRPRTRLHTNPSWELARERVSDADLITFLNDDLLIGRRFFDLLHAAYEMPHNFGGFCPNTVDTPNKIKGAVDLPVITPMLRREGWAFSLKGVLLRQIPLIPKELSLFCGDDWFWYWSHKLGFLWVKIMNSFVYHYVGSSLKGSEFETLLKVEKRAFAQLTAEK